jgi:hypothetical protein
MRKAIVRFGRGVENGKAKGREKEGLWSGSGPVINFDVKSTQVDAYNTVFMQIHNKL